MQMPWEIAEQRPRGITDRERQVLDQIGKACKRNSPIKNRHWTETPHLLDVQAVTKSLGKKGFVRCKGGMWWKVQPTDKGWRQIEAERLWKLDQR